MSFLLIFWEQNYIINTVQVGLSDLHILSSTVWWFLAPFYFQLSGLLRWLTFSLTFFSSAILNTTISTSVVNLFPTRRAWPFQLYLMPKAILAEMTYHFLSNPVIFPQNTVLTLLALKSALFLANLSCDEDIFTYFWLFLSKTQISPLSFVSPHFLHLFN